jgi:hypothetical protein
MHKFLIFYYDGNEDKVCIIEGEDLFKACEKLGDTLSEGMSWEEALRHAIDIGYISDNMPQEMIQIFNNVPGAGEWTTLAQVEVIG